MKEYFVYHTVKDKETQDLVTVALDLDYYCKSVNDKIFYAIRQFEEIIGDQISIDKTLKSNLFDAIGMIKRLPKNIFIDGDTNDRL